MTIYSGLPWGPLISLDVYDLIAIKSVSSNDFIFVLRVMVFDQHILSVTME